MSDLNRPEFERLRLMMAGTCVRPMVHDANNYLGAALAYAELAQMEPGISGKAVRQLGEVVGAITRCSRLMNLFAQLVRPMRNAQEYSIIELVRETIELRLYTFRVAGVQVHTEYPDELEAIYGYPAATQYALLTILHAAEQHLFEGDGERTLRISVEALGDHAAVRFRIQKVDSPAEHKETPPSIAQQELTIESAIEGIEAQNGSIVMRSDGEYMVTLPFVHSADALQKQILRRDD